MTYSVQEMMIQGNANLMIFIKSNGKYPVSPENMGQERRVDFGKMP
jgi:hypothetical protein